MKIRLILFFLVAPHLLAQSPVQQQINTLTRAAQIYEREGQVDRAIQFYIQICHLKPSHINSYLSAKRLLLRKQDLQQLEQLILFLQDNRNDSRYEIDLAAIAYKRGNEKKALKQWDDIIKRNPREHKVYSLVGRELLDVRRLDHAEKVYLQGRQELDNPTLYTFELATVYSIQEKFKKLFQEYLNFLQHNPMQINYIESEVDRLCNDAAKVPRLLFSLENLLKADAQPEWAVLILLGNLYVESAEFENALQYYDDLEQLIHDQKLSKKIRNYHPGKYIFSLGTTAMQQEQLDVAEQAFLLIQNGPYFDNAQLHLAKIYTKQKKYETAIAFLQQYGLGTKNSERAQKALLEIGDIYFYEMWELEKATETFMKVMNEPSRYLNEARFKLSECFIAQNQLEKAKSFLLQIKKTSVSGKNRDYYQSVYDLAELELFAQQPARALLTLEPILMENENIPSDIENDALQLSLMLTENIFDSTALACLGKAKLLHEQRNYSKSIELIVDYLEKNPLSIIKDELNLLLAQNYSISEKLSAAIEIYLTLYHDEMSLYRDLALYQIAELYTLQGDSIKATEYYEKILVEFPFSLYLEKARESILALENE